MFVNGHGRELLAAEPWADAVELVTHPLLGIRGVRALTETTLLGALASHRSLRPAPQRRPDRAFAAEAANVVTIAD